VDAEVGPGLDWVTGRIRLEDAEGIRLVDPLATVPRPVDDLTRTRTFPGLPEEGLVRFRPVGEGIWAFHAILPRRYGDVGATRAGLFAKGAGLPQPVDADGLPLVRWEVTVRVPEGVLAAVGTAWGRGEVRWQGEAERVPLAVLPRARA